MRFHSRFKSKSKPGSKVNASDASDLEEAPGKHDQPAEGGRATIDEAIVAATGPSLSSSERSSRKISSRRSWITRRKAA